MISGMAGINHFRVIKMLSIEGMPNNRPAFTLTKWSLYFGTAPSKLVTPTMNKEYAEARTASTWKKYTSIGIERIEPPPPNKPRIIPMPIENRYPTVSILTECCDKSFTERTIKRCVFSQIESNAIVFYDKHVREFISEFFTKIFSFLARRKLAENKTIVFYSINNFYLNPDLFLIRIFEILGQPHQIYQFLIGSDLHTESFWLPPCYSELIKLLLFNSNLINGAHRLFFCFSIPRIYYLKFHIGQPFINESKLFGRRF